jgi:hypothetical protein
MEDLTMKQKKMIQKLALTVATACLALTAFVCPMTSVSVQASETETVEEINTGIQPRKDYISYVFKIEDGKLYKRLYNYSSCNWIGDWIYVSDYPG